MRLILPLLSFACLTQTSIAQTIVNPGFEVVAINATPAAFGTYASLSNGDIFSFDGQSFDLYAANGTFLSNLGSLPVSTFTSFAIIDPSETFAVIGENSTGELHTVDLSGGGTSLVTSLTFNFDARFDIDPGFVWVSAATGGFGNGNDIVRVELATGNTDFVAHVAGPSGPLDVDAAGDLYYATLDPNFAPADGTDLLRWDRSDLLSGNLLSELDATVVLADLDGASTLRVSPKVGNIFLVEANFAAASHKLLEIDPLNGTIFDEVAEVFTWPGNLEFFSVAGAGTFHEYQPSGVVAFMSDTDFGNSTQDRVSIHSKRPSAALSGPTVGPAAKTLTFENAEPNSAVLLFWGSISDHQTTELQFDLGLGAPFHSSFAMNRIRRQPLLTPTDANGTAIFQYFDPGNLHGTLAFQAVVMSPTAALLGSTESVTN